MIERSHEEPNGNIVYENNVVVRKMRYKINTAEELLVTWEVRMKAARKAKDVDNIKGKLSDMENRNKNRVR